MDTIILHAGVIVTINVGLAQARPNNNNKKAAAVVMVVMVVVVVVVVLVLWLATHI